jgi:hypothetical protein
MIVANLCHASVYAGLRPRTPLKWDAFSQIPCAEEVLRIDNYGNELRKQPSTLAAVIIYAGRHDTRRGEVVARLFGIRDHLKNANSIDLNRIVILDGGFREKLEVQLWILPAEARDAVTTLLDLGAASKDTRLKRPGLSKWEYKCRGGR